MADLQEISQAARAATTKFQSGHLGRSNPVYKLARSFYRSGNIRDLVAMRAQANQKSPWQEFGDPVRSWKVHAATSTGLPGEFGSHSIDTLAWFTGGYPESVSGTGSILAHDDGREIPDTVSCHFRYSGGVGLNFEATLANSFDGIGELVLGTMGSFRLAGTHGWMIKESGRRDAGLGGLRDAREAVPRGGVSSSSPTPPSWPSKAS